MIRQGTEEESEGQRESAGELSRVPTHLTDAASDTQETEKDLANADRESRQLTLIDDALRRLREDPDAYTTGEGCDAPIEDERLDLVPWTRLCASCARETNAGASQD